MRAPLVAVVAYHLPLGRVTRWDSGAYALPETYVDAVRRAGARPVLLAGTDSGTAEEVLERVDGLLLAGGGDLDPSRYGADPHPLQYGIDPDRDSTEIDLALAADRQTVPTLGICRGAQILNVAFGGTLHQHIADSEALGSHGVPGGGEPVIHEIKISEASRVASACGRTVLTSMCHHHQGIDRLGEGLVATAWAGDGLVEAVERPDGWMVAVQWHPEETAGSDPSQQALFDAFVLACGRR